MFHYDNIVVLKTNTELGQNMSIKIQDLSHSQQILLSYIMGESLKAFVWRSAIDPNYNLADINERDRSSAQFKDFEKLEAKGLVELVKDPRRSGVVVQNDRVRLTESGFVLAKIAYNNISSTTYDRMLLIAANMTPAQPPQSPHTDMHGEVLFENDLEQITMSAIDVFSKSTGCNGEPLGDIVQDLLCCLLHLEDDGKYDFEKSLERARHEFQEDIKVNRCN